MNLFESSAEQLAGLLAEITELLAMGGSPFIYENGSFNKQQRLRATLGAASRRSNTSLENLINNQKSPKRVQRLT